MNRLPTMREKIQNYPVPKPVYTVSTDYSGDLTFDRPSKNVECPFENPTWLEAEVADQIENKLEKQDDGTYNFVNQVDTTESNIINAVLRNLKEALQRAMPNQEPTRTKLFKFFRSWSPKTDKDKELVLAIYDYVDKNRHDVYSPGSKHAEAFLGLITHIRSKNDR